MAEAESVTRGAVSGGKIAGGVEAVVWTGEGVTAGIIVVGAARYAA